MSIRSVENGEQKTFSGNNASVAKPSTPILGTVTLVSGASTIPFTANTLGPTPTSYTVTSTSGLTSTGATSPRTIIETVDGTYTYTIFATNANGNSVTSSASNSVTVVSFIGTGGTTLQLVDINITNLLQHQPFLQLKEKRVQLKFWQLQAVAVAVNQIDKEVLTAQVAVAVAEELH
jgi:hypothetical protein